MSLSMKYFVLSPYKDTPYGEASRLALDQYAIAIQEHDSVLCEELQQWLKDIRDASTQPKEVQDEPIYIHLPVHSLPYLIKTIKYYGETFTYFGNVLWSHIAGPLITKLSRWAMEHSFQTFKLTHQELSLLRAIVNLERKYVQKNRNQWTELYANIDRVAENFSIAEEKYE